MSCKVERRQDTEARLRLNLATFPPELSQTSQAKSALFSPVETRIEIRLLYRHFAGVNLFVDAAPFRCLVARIARNEVPFVQPSLIPSFASRRANSSTAGLSVTAAQVKALRQAGCKRIFEEKASGGGWTRPLSSSEKEMCWSSGSSTGYHGL